MPRGARAVAVLNEGEAVDDADSSSVPACDSILDSSDPLTAGSQAGTKTVGGVGAFHAQHHRQQRPVHPRATNAGSGMNGDGIAGSARYISSRASKSPETFVALLTSSW